MMQTADRPLRYALPWTRMVQKLLGLESMHSVAAIKVQEVRKKHVNSMDWVKDVNYELEREPEEDEETRLAKETVKQKYFDAQAAFEEQCRKVVSAAHEKHFGDTKTLAETSKVGKGWRGEWSVHRSVRT